MEVSRGAAYGLGLSQCAIVLGVVLFSPSVQVDVFVAHVRFNGTIPNVVLISDTQTMKAHMGLPMLAASALAGIFATVTCHSYDTGISGQDFQPEVLEQLGLWDMLFWAYCLITHCMVVLMVANPVDLYGCVSGTVFMVYFLCRACSPKGQHASLTQENLNILGYCLGVLQLVYQTSDSRSGVGSAVMLMVVLDYFLGVGHTYDRHTTIETVTNCRLFYICAGSLCLAIFYSMYNVSETPLAAPYS